LPAANSRKWHNRRFWDSLGYLRVRSLANPTWHRDIGWLIGILQREDSDPRIDEAIRAADRYLRLRPEDDHEMAWDAILEPIDQFLEIRQARHIEEVIKAGASGRSADS